ncbi:MAG: hypothetical protein QOJ58_4622 [Alphaproteobacteria bacterium]|jgi:hypothetical protein|nr:hypothetical protein [Mycobacterium sp.]MEA2958994.1 hypothetical protein [Alphaproteobacteria bacterium]
MDDPTSLLFCRDGFRVVDVVRAHTALVTATVQWLPPPAPTRVRGIDETRARRVRWLLEPLVDGSRIRG